ncbi:hypothetical protein H6P81_007003 [Aristolochia fimbriata]|uniref:Uncharacterized protein n=1 Tax=Aristolochia fimbriata TaxID=158543 RepID=A0AAV7F020_ARIFI|nr:hypothetical protein H6P81_007003 [Aristolochia fimbriata]
MAATATAPVEIGTRGTVGSLVFQEMEYYNKLDLNLCHPEQRGQPSQIPAMVVSSWVDSGPNLGYSIAASKSKKKRRSGGFLPSICSAVDVIDNRMDLVPGCNYRNLRTDVKRLGG